jgi:hypothetical protein
MIDLKKLPKDLKEWVRLRNRGRRDYISRAMAEFHKGDCSAMLDAIFDPPSEWTKDAFKAIARLQPPNTEFQEHFMIAWQVSGDSYRDEVDDDLLLLDALRVLLPRYQGPEMKLWRGESIHNRDRRTYGMSWSSDKDVARAFALNNRIHLYGDCVLLETVASPDAIVCETIPIAKNEDEFIVDRRHLQYVQVIEQFAQESSDPRGHWREWVSP